MTMRGQRIFHTQRVQSWLRRRLQAGRFVLVSLYVAYLALVLPFICWGATAQPGHPHRRPHFVFAAPAITPAASVQEGARPSAHQQKKHSSPTASTTHQKQSPSPSAKPSTPTGRSVPTLLAFSILLLVAVGTLMVAPTHRPPLILLLPTFFPKLTISAVPVPPPRLVISCYTPFD
jgi:hypothetical protein